MAKVISMKCMKCGREETPRPDRYTCDTCGIDGILDIIYDYKSTPLTINDLERNPDRSLWRYRCMLPIEAETPVSPLQVGWTPLYKQTRLEREFGLGNVFIKDDGRNPSASLKDRASAIGVAKAIEAKAKAICAASTGNAASSLSAFAASMGIPAYIFVPKRAPRAKVAQLLVYGAHTLLIDSTYDRAFELSVEASRRYGFYSRNCAYNPYLVEGKKTVAYEIWEQLGYKIPDRVYVSIGDGCITAGLYKGFYDLVQIGLSDRLPRIIGVQAAGCNPMEVAMKTGEFKEQTPDTIADSIAVGVPRNRLKALRGLKASAGECISVTDDAIRESLVGMPRVTGVFGEPAAVTAYAGFRKQAHSGVIGNNETVVILITGNGLKDIESALSVCTMPEPIDPTFDAVEKYLR
ncbi:MAG: threonine synthase [Candidatus Riflebacteria bacterium]|nr:threonine synthase [Candidatus Riflebacteria bacterium]